MTDLSGYTSALKGAAFYVIPGPGYLYLEGKDGVAFLQRQTTNDVARLTSTNAVMSVLTSPKARIQDVFWLFEEADGVGIITLPGRSTATYDFLRSRIFFNDNVTLSDRSHENSQIILDGPKSVEVLATLGFPRIDFAQVCRKTFGDAQIVIVGQTGFRGKGYRLIVPNSEMSSLLEKFVKSGIAQLRAEEYENLRVEAGLPGEIRELTTDYTPLEVGLLEMAISNTKGCYTGQEVIARQVNFDKVTRKLIGLRLEGQVQVGDSVTCEGKIAGKVTSVARSPRFGEIALAVMKRPFDLAGSIVAIEGTQGEVVALPF